MLKVITNEVKISDLQIKPFYQDYGDKGNAVAIIYGFTFIVVAVTKADEWMPYYFIEDHLHRISGVEKDFITSLVNALRSELVDERKQNQNNH